MTRKSKARYGLKRTYRVNPTVKALRAALMTAMLATAASQAAAAPPQDIQIIDNAGPGASVVVNNADLTAYAEFLAGGILSFGDTSDVFNTGRIAADAVSLYQTADAFGIRAEAYQAGSVYNAGDIDVAATSFFQDAYAWGISASSYRWTYQDASVINTGDIAATSNAFDGFTQTSQSVGIAVGAGNLASVDNSGDITLSANVASTLDPTALSTAKAVGIYANGYGVDIVNTGDIQADVNNNMPLGDALAFGIVANAYGDIVIRNSGDIALSGTSGGGYQFAYYNYTFYDEAGTLKATGIDARAVSGNIDIVNDGDIRITDNNPGGGFAANGYHGDYLSGIYARSDTGSIHIRNNGDLLISGGESAWGVYATTQKYGGDAVIENTGNITITGGIDQPDYRFRAWTVGLSASTQKYGGSAVVVNSGDLSITNVGSGGAIGVNAFSNQKYNYGEAAVSNSGDITVTAPEFAYGISAQSNSYVSVYNSGSITATTENTTGQGIFAVSDDRMNVINHGDLVVTGGLTGLGINARSIYDGSIVNTGDISVSASEYYSLVDYYGYSYNVGGTAIGAVHRSFAGTSDMRNSGNIQANGALHAYGIVANSVFGDSVLVNSGDIDVAGYLGNAYALTSRGGGYGAVGRTLISNTGDLTVDAHLLGKGILAAQTSGNIEIGNEGSVSVNGYYSATGIEAYNFVGSNFVVNKGDLQVRSDAGFGVGILSIATYGSIVIGNEGQIDVHSAGNAFGLLADTSGYRYDYYPGHIRIVSSGDISAVSDYARAAGIQTVTSTGYTRIFNYADILAEGDTRASGILASNVNYGNVFVQQSASIDVSANGRAEGISVSATYGDAVAVNDGSINVVSGGYASGITAMSVYGDAVAYNYGDIVVSGASLSQGLVAKAYSDTGMAFIRNEGDVSVDSSAGYANAVAVRSGAAGSQVLNFGSLSATGPDAWTVNAVGGPLTFVNYGSMQGSLIADAGDDTLYNADGATMRMNNDRILLGTGSNTFINAGSIQVDGANNLIDMNGLGSQISPLAVSSFENYGGIGMVDGIANDVLTVRGGFSGFGDISVDVNGALLTSDRVVINGSVEAGTSQSVNVNLLSLPSLSDMVAGKTIGIISVTGTSSASNFNVGLINLPDTPLYTLEYQLGYDKGVHSLGFDVTGLTATGSLLTSTAPAIQNIWHAGVGSMYERQGSERNFAEDGTAEVSGAAGAWARYYSENGTLDPDAIRVNFGNNGGQRFDFNTIGFEAGVGYSFNTAWTVGLFGGKVEGEFRPTSGGKAKLDGDTLGAYVTYTPGNGFYADLSYRATEFNGDLFSGNEALTADADAEGYSLELGYGFKTKTGLEIAPQLQYSMMSADFTAAGYGGSDFALTDGDSAELRAGVSVRKTYTMDQTVWTQYAALSYVDVSSSSNRYLIGGTLQGGADISGGSTLLELGMDARYKDWLYKFGISAQQGGAYQSVLGVQMNARYSW
jgi:outer membrane autotransporter protein